MEEEENWNEAEATCSQQGAHLVSIWDELEQAYIFTNVKSTQSWIGMKKEAVCFRFVYYKILVSYIQGIFYICFNKYF